MHSVYDVARYFLNKLGPMDAEKLHALCYYAQAWTLAKLGRPLFQEEFYRIDGFWEEQRVLHRSLSKKSGV